MNVFVQSTREEEAKDENGAILLEYIICPSKVFYNLRHFQEAFQTFQVYNLNVNSFVAIFRLTNSCYSAALVNWFFKKLITQLVFHSL